MSRVTRLLNLFRRASLEREFDDELRFHLERRVEHNIDLGMSQQEAEADADRRLGAIGRARDGMRKARTVPVRPVALVSAAAAATILVVLAATLPSGGTRQIYELSDAVSPPVPVETHLPEYTHAAKDARITGAVRVQCVVQPAGVCSDLIIVDSLDRAYGLDDEAIRAAGHWRFRPALRDGAPVATRIVLEFTFALR